MGLVEEVEDIAADQLLESDTIMSKTYDQTDLVGTRCRLAELLIVSMWAF